jgi:transposase
MERHLVEDVGFRAFAAGNQPDFRTLSDFRKRHLTALEGLFEQVLKVTLLADKVWRKAWRNRECK